MAGTFSQIIIMGQYNKTKSRRDDKIIIMEQYNKIKPRRGDTNATLSGFVKIILMNFYNPYTPSGFNL